LAIGVKYSQVKNPKLEGTGVVLLWKTLLKIDGLVLYFAITLFVKSTMTKLAEPLINSP
jgi:hypothetical protein